MRGQRMIRPMLVGTLFVAAIVAGGCADAPAPGEPTLYVTNGWARAADSGEATALYFTLGNLDTLPDTLNGVRSDAAEEVGLHISMQRSRTMHMTPIAALPVPAQDSVMFRPLGAHVMLTGLRAAAVAGDTLRAVLTFVSGDSLVVHAHVRTP